MRVKSKLGALRRRAWELQLPKVFDLTDLDERGVKFEATNFAERQRIVARGEEAEYITAMLAALRPDDVLFDIGANVGLVALHAARKCRTVAFEPDPSFLARLHRNLELNPDLCVEVLQLAISNDDGATTLYTDGAEGNSPSLVHQRGERGAVKVRTQTLDSLLDSGSLPAPTVLKLDIEGAEILALRGAKRLLDCPTRPRALFLEVHDSFLPGFGSSAEEVLALVGEAGYGKVSYEARRRDQQHLILQSG
ncbi:MAG: FkbM family methyltransferase [Actinobacteria bacterium]|nr:FkbM family methyltransferase [Actinomycetota bacterium]